MKMTNKKLAITAVASVLFFSGAAMAAQTSGSVTLDGSISAATCTVELPNTTVSFPAVTTGQLSNTAQWAPIHDKQSTTPIVVRDCGDSDASLTVTSSSTVEGAGYAYPRVGGQPQRDFAIWMNINDEGVKYNTPIAIKNGSLPISFEVVKTSNNSNISYTGSWTNVYTLTATYN